MRSIGYVKKGLIALNVSPCAALGWQTRKSLIAIHGLDYRTNVRDDEKWHAQCKTLHIAVYEMGLEFQL